MDEQFTFEFEQRPTIKGFPELRWTGKRPYRSTQYFPAQLRESYGDAQNGWINKIFWGDNLQVMSHLLKEFRGKIDLIYIDPPFDSKADYKKKIDVRGAKASSDATSFEEKQYTDIWTNDEYLQFIYERLLICRELLSDTGSIYVHMDEKRAHYVRQIMDEVFGQNNFRREIIWDITVLSGFKSQAQNWIRGHDVILYYAKNIGQVKYNKLFQKQSQKYLKRFNKVDENGRRYFDGRGERRYLDDVIKKGKPYGDVWGDVLSYQSVKAQLAEIE
jgi:DNA methylase N-4/N-6 domain protein